MGLNVELNLVDTPAVVTATANLHVLITGSGVSDDDDSIK